jgi:hypothetical protein
MSWPAVTFTYSGGAQRLPWWVRGIRQAGFCPVVCHDGNDPLPGHVLGWLEAEGVEVVKSTWPRRGNLNGTDTAARICGELAAVAARHDAPYVLKVDDDTYIADPEVFTCVQQAAAVGLLWPGDPRGGAYGMAYALRSDTAAEIAEHFDRLPVDVAAPEDLAIWAAAKALAGPAGVMAWEFDIEEGPFAAIPLGSCPKDAVDRYGVITVGNEPRGGWTDKPSQTAEALKRVVCAGRAMARKRGCNAA